MMLDDNQVLKVRAYWIIDGVPMGAKEAFIYLSADGSHPPPDGLYFDLRTRIDCGPTYGIRQFMPADLLVDYADASEQADFILVMLAMMQSKTTYAVDRWRQTGAME